MPARNDIEEVPQPLSPDQQEMISKRLSVVLRHDKGEFQLRFDERALVPLDEFLQLPIMRTKRIDRKQVLSVYRSDKQRFRAVIKAGKTFIGASQGHSFKIDPDRAHTHTPTEKMPSLVHGAHYDFLQSILQHGIRPGGLREGHRQVALLAGQPLVSQVLPAGRGCRAPHFTTENGCPTVQVSQRLLHDQRDCTGQGYRNGLGIVGSSEVAHAERDRPSDLKAVAQTVLRVQTKGSRTSAPSRSSALRAYMSALNASCCFRRATLERQVGKPVHKCPNASRQDPPSRAYRRSSTQRARA